MSAKPLSRCINIYITIKIHQNCKLVRIICRDTNDKHLQYLQETILCELLRSLCFCRCRIHMHMQATHSASKFRLQESPKFISTKFPLFCSLSLYQEGCNYCNYRTICLWNESFYLAAVIRLSATSAKGGFTLGNNLKAKWEICQNFSTKNWFILVS